MAQFRIGDTVFMRPDKYAEARNSGLLEHQEEITEESQGKVTDMLGDLIEVEFPSGRIMLSREFLTNADLQEGGRRRYRKSRRKTRSVHRRTRRARKQRSSRKH